MLCSFAASGLALEKSQGSFQQDRTDRADFHPWLPQAERRVGQGSFWRDIQDLRLKPSGWIGSPPPAPLPSILEAKSQLIWSCYKLAGFPPRLRAWPLFPNPCASRLFWRTPSGSPGKARCTVPTNLHNYKVYLPT